MGLLLAKDHEEGLGLLECCIERFVKCFESWDDHILYIVVSKDFCGSFKLLFDQVKAFASLFHSFSEGFINLFKSKLAVIFISEITEKTTKVFKVVWDVGDFESFTIFVSIHKLPEALIEGISTY